MSKKFDLNIEKVLDNWEVYHAIREVIANALDEQLLSQTPDIQIFKDEQDNWHIRDYGRGLKYSHFTQNENAEKLSSTHVIGKFGVGLKDALATFDRHDITVEINSRYGHYTIEQVSKHGFADLITLHVCIDDPLDLEFVGTEFILGNCPDDEIYEAKQLFLQYANLDLLDSTSYGEIYRKRETQSEIFVNGIKVAEEESFLFSYNITAPNAALKKALNRERINVGRGAYSDRIKDILLKATSSEVIDEFMENLNNIEGGEQSDELRWKDVTLHFLEVLNQREDVVFMTPEENNDMSGRTREIVEECNKRKVVITATLLDSLRKKSETDSDFSLNTVTSVLEDYNDSFEYQFVYQSDFSTIERANFNLCSAVVRLIYPEYSANRIFISETMRPSEEDDDSEGVCEDDGERIVISRRVLDDRAKFLGVVAHELIHAKTGHLDCSRDFENDLTTIIGSLLDATLAAN